MRCYQDGLAQNSQGYKCSPNEVAEGESCQEESAKHGADPVGFTCPAFGTREDPEDEMAECKYRSEEGRVMQVVDLKLSRQRQQSNISELKVSGGLHENDAKRDPYKKGK